MWKTQVWVVSASDPQLPLQIEDAGRRVTEDEEGNFAKVEIRTPDWKKIISFFLNFILELLYIQVNQDTRLDNRVLDLRTPTNQAIFRQTLF